MSSLQQIRNREERIPSSPFAPASRQTIQDPRSILLNGQQNRQLPRNPDRPFEAYWRSDENDPKGLSSRLLPSPPPRDLPTASVPQARQRQWRPKVFTAMKALFRKDRESSFGYEKAQRETTRRTNQDQTLSNKVVPSETPRIPLSIEKQWSHQVQNSYPSREIYFSAMEPSAPAQQLFVKQNNLYLVAFANFLQKRYMLIHAPVEWRWDSIVPQEPGAEPTVTLQTPTDIYSKLSKFHERSLPGHDRTVIETTVFVAISWRGGRDAIPLNVYPEASYAVPGKCCRWRVALPSHLSERLGISKMGVIDIIPKYEYSHRYEYHRIRLDQILEEVVIV